MYAIVEIGGHQYKVEKSQEIFVNRLEGDAGSKIDFDQVLLIENQGAVNVGAPVISGALVTATIVEHLKADKVIIFKKKRRKGYKKKNGHRQYITKLQIQSIVEQGGVAAKMTKTEKPVAKKEAAPKAEVKTEKVKATPAAEAKEAKPAKKKEAPAKTEDKETKE